LAKALAAELGLTAQWLLGDEAVRPDRASVDLVVDEMVQLEHVDVADRHLTVELLAGAPVHERHLTRRGKTRLAQHPHNVVLAGTVEHGARHRHAARQVAGELSQLLGAERLDLAAFLCVDLTEEAAQILVAGGLAADLVEHIADAAPETCR